MEALSSYGFVFEGLKNGRMPKRAKAFSAACPKEPAIWQVLELVAKKAANTQQADGGLHYGNGFLGWNYRLLEQDLSTAGFGQEADYLADRLRVRQDKEFVYRFHEAMKRQGYAHRNEGWNEGPDICYYESKASADKKRPYLFRLLSWKSELRLYLCIRNA